MNLGLVASWVLHGIKLVTFDVESLVFWKGRVDSKDIAPVKFTYLPGAKDLLKLIRQKMKIPIHVLVNDLTTLPEELTILQENENVRLVPWPHQSLKPDIRFYKTALERASQSKLKPQAILHIGQLNAFDHKNAAKEGYNVMVIDQAHEDFVRVDYPHIKKNHAFQSILDLLSFFKQPVKEKSTNHEHREVSSGQNKHFKAKKQIHKG